MAEFAGFAVTTDTIACGVHFLPDDPLDTVAQKAVRVNASDLIAKGCHPRAMTLASAWHRDADEADHAAFARGLAADLGAYGIALLGGDTARLPTGQGPVFTVTMFGEPNGDRVPDRSGAVPGDLVAVSGLIGDAMLGLRQATGAWDAGIHADAVLAAYRRPNVRDVASTVAWHATASLDVSDGLIADAGHIAARSGVRVVIEADAVPISGAGRAYLAGGGAFADLVTGGDDYAVLMTTGRDDEGVLKRDGFIVIGRCVPGSGVALQAANGTDITPKRTGFRHF